MKPAPLTVNKIAMYEDPARGRHEISNPDQNGAFRPLTADNWITGGGVANRNDHLLEVDHFDLPMADRLIASSQKILDQQLSNNKNDFLKRYQLPAHDNFGHYLMDVATCPEHDTVTPFCRIILPPRTGKTVIAAAIIQLTKLCSVFVVPTKTLVLQTARELSTRIPGIPIGLYYSEKKQIIPNGINICTYATLQQYFALGKLSRIIRRAALVFLDEAHHAMTPKRLNTIREAFDEKSLRIALTATPDYADHRRLHRYFPKLIHEIDLFAAMDKKLLAPTRMWVASVDVDASKIRVVAGDYEPEMLGQLMSSSPFFKAVETFRYSKSHIGIPAIITCASRQQATELWHYLKKHRPRKRPEPALILGETPPAQREQFISGFSEGYPDTLIQVGVLIEGWNAPNCKLLLDLAPSLSIVRATQKYFRVMTRYRDQEARIVVILPENMQKPPILPVDLMLPPGETYRCGDLLLGSDTISPARCRPVTNIGDTPIISVQTKTHLIARVSFTKPKLDPRNVRQIRRVLLSNPHFSLKHTLGIMRFRRLSFMHPLFSGSGETLLRYLSVDSTTDAFISFLTKIFPEIMGKFFLNCNGGPWNEQWHSCRKDFEYVWRNAMSPRDNDGKPVEALTAALHMLCGGPRQIASPEDCVLIRERIDKLFELLMELDERAQRVLKYRLGLSGEPELTWDQIGILFDITQERVRQIFRKSVRILNHKYCIRTRDTQPVVTYCSEAPELVAIIGKHFAP